MSNGSHVPMRTADHDRGRSRLFAIMLALVASMMSTRAIVAQEKAAAQKDAPPNLAVLSDEKWKRIDSAVDNGLAFIARNQQPDGSFASARGAQPGATSLCGMAFLSRGHVPGNGPYAKQLERAIEFTLGAQRSNGMISVGSSTTQSGYNHAVASLMLSEVYGMTAGAQSKRIQQAIPRALEFSRSLQTDEKRNKRDLGGWRYVGKIGPNDSDLTATSWHLMFYRSAKNAEFEVPANYIEEAMGYVHRCFDDNEGGFVYALAPNSPDDEYYASGGTVGGGVIALAMAGEHRTEMGEACGRWILNNPFDRYNRRRHPEDRYHYSAYYCSQAMFQLGGKFWEEFYPPFQETLLANQRQDGSWDSEAIKDGFAGNIYSTSLAVLALTPPYQLLPIYQR